MYKQNVMYLCNEILFIQKKEWSTNLFYDMNGPWKHDAKWKMLETNGHILYNSVYMNCAE